jgi:hypothetical protein
MAATDDELEAEKPLDPAMERVRRKLARLMVVSIGIMLIGLMAVLGAVVYKSAGSGDSGGPSEAVIDLPDGFEISGTAISDTRILFTGTDADGTRRALSYDAQTGNIVANHVID